MGSTMKKYEYAYESKGMQSKTQRILYRVAIG